jgi:hypothetical protein
MLGVNDEPFRDAKVLLVYLENVDFGMELLLGGLLTLISGRLKLCYPVEVLEGLFKWYLIPAALDTEIGEKS